MPPSSLPAFALAVRGHPTVTFAELGEVSDEITNIRGVLAGRHPRTLAVVTLRQAPWTVELQWLQRWYHAARHNRQRSQMDFSVVVETGSRTVARCDVTAGWPTKLVIKRGPGQTQILENLTLHGAAVKVQYL